MTRPGWRRPDEAPWSRVPGTAWAWLLAALLLTALWVPLRPPPVARAVDLPAAPALAPLRLLALGEPETLTRLLLALLFSYDTQPGVSLRYRDLDYERVADWLGRLLQLDPEGQGPLLAAARLYGEVNDPPRQRRMIDFIRSHYPEDRVRRWPWMAHAVFLARHRLQDLPLALALARELAQDAPPEVPAWARQMHLFVLEDMGEVEAAKILIGGLLSSGKLEDPNEAQFLAWRLRQMESGPAGKP